MRCSGLWRCVASQHSAAVLFKTMVRDLFGTQQSARVLSLVPVVTMHSAAARASAWWLSRRVAWLASNFHGVGRLRGDLLGIGTLRFTRDLCT